MNTPQIEFTCLRDAIATNRTTTLDVLVKIVPPQPEAELKRPQLNLGLVIDRSGSMAGEKLQYARQAACYAVEQLLPRDRVSVTVYDDTVETIIPSCLAEHKASLLHRIQRIAPKGCTALHAGWVEGGMQVSQHLNPQHLNRIILLSDGLANRGETNPDVIASDVKGLSDRDVSTTTMGVGANYNEDLLEAMANSGDGNYYYIESPEQLPEIFAMEMQGIMALFGRAARLGITPHVGVTVADVLNDFDVAPEGLYKLPNLIKGNPFTAIVRLKIPPQTERVDLCHINLSWENPETGNRENISIPLQLPPVSDAQLEEFPFNPEVRQQVALMMAARAKKEAVQLSDRGDLENASKRLQKARQDVLNAPQSPLTEQEAQSLVDLDTDLKQRRMNAFRKRSHYESHSYGRSLRQASHGDYYAQRGYSQPSKPSGDRLVVLPGDITTLEVNAIVNASDRALSGSIGVSAAIHRAAGKELRRACEQLGMCNPGEAKITPGYNLAAQWIIHTVGPTWFGGQSRESEILAQCYDACLTLAVQYQCKTIAFPAISTGAKGFPLDYAARIALKQIRAFLDRETTIEKVSIICFEPNVRQAYRKEIGRE
ncbi:macro domain-containing protein [Lusitaniella coriacea]|uniref:macro domain-containing protein n=1 Tax=Lusitaniella coriacea TaxID=1983105 RepID=UPI003CEFD303